MRVARALALMALVALLGTGCVDRLGRADGTDGSEAAGNAAGGAVVPAAAPRAVVDAVNLRNLRLGPVRPAVGVAYPFDLYSHCGIDFVYFGGRVWRAEQAMAEPRTLPDSNGVVTYTGYVAGTITLLDDATARFVIDDRRYEVAGPPIVILHPTTAKPSRCQ